MSTYNKKIIMPLADIGDGGKSTTLIATGAGLEAAGKPFSKFEADKDHHTFFDTFSAKNKNGEPKAEQDSETGCVQIDINNDPQKIADTVAAEYDNVLVDTPARSITAVLGAFGVDGTQLFFDTLAYNNAAPYFLYPWIDDDKSVEGIDKLYQNLDGLDFGGYENGFVINVIICMNNGLMNASSKSMPAQALAAYQKSITIKAMQNDPRFNVQVVNLRTQLTQPAINALKGKTIQQALAEKLEPSTKTLLMSLLNDGKNIAKLL